MTEAQRKDYDNAVSSLSSIPKGAASRMIWERILEDWAVCRGKDVKPPVPVVYTAVDFADRAKELRERARKYRDGKFDDVADAVEADAKMMDYGAALAAIRYDAKQEAGSMVYDLNHLAQVPPSKQAMADLARNCLKQAMRIWNILANGEENR